MNIAVSLHSYKGGTGKTTIAANLAALLAYEGKNICILDYDFRAPSLYVIFKEHPKKWVNDYLNDKSELEDILINLSAKYKLKGTLTTGLANPSSEALRDMLSKDRKWEMKALQKTIGAKRVLLNEMKYDLLIIDTSPGIQYSSINAIVASDQVLLIMKVDEFDLEGTKELINSIYEPLGRKTRLVINKLPLKEIGKKIADETVQNIKKSFKLDIVGKLPCDCMLMFSGGKHLFSLEDRQHPFSKEIKNISEKIKALTHTPS